MSAAFRRKIPAKKISVDEARNKVLTLCSRAEQCPDDIRSKLLSWGIARDETETIINWLTERRFLDEARFAKVYARDKAVYSGWGKIKIKAALATKKIPSTIISDALDEAIDDEQYHAQMLKAAKAKARGLDLSDYSDRHKLMMHLRAKGYEPSLIIHLMESVILKNDRLQW